MATLQAPGNLRIGEVARQVDVTVETIRYYEKIGLLEPAERELSSGYRVFPMDAVERLRFVRRGQELGFSLEEIRELLDLQDNPGARAADVRGRVEQKLGGIYEKIDALRRMADSLERLARSCDGRGSVRDCSILESLQRSPDTD